MDREKFHVRTALMPLYYKDFRCLAADCRDNCCRYNWEISFTKKDYLKLKRAAKSQEFQAILADGMSRLRDDMHDGHYAHFNVGPEGGCAFQTEDGLCRLQMECGVEAMPEVCRVYPRRSLYTSAAKELSLSPSCEGVLALLWDLPQGVDFLEEDLPRQDWRVVTGEGRYDWFPQVRSLCIDVLQERSLPLSRRMLLLAMALQRLGEMDWTAEETPEVWLAWTAELLHSPSAAALESLPRDRLRCLTWNIRVLLELYENTAAEERSVYRSLFSALSADGEAWEDKGLERFSIDAARYQALEDRLEGLLGRSDCFFENLMVTTAFLLAYPSMNSPEVLWHTCADLCMLYSFYRFSAVLGCHQEASRERLFEVTGQVCRGLLHNNWRRDLLVRALLQDGGSLAHMAILTGG